MSINDILDKVLNSNIFSSSSLFVLIIPLIALIPFIIRGKNNIKKIYGDNEVGTPKIERNSVIISKTQEQPYPNNKSFKVNYVVFDINEHSRVKLAIKDSNTFSLLEVGDCGTLEYLG